MKLIFLHGAPATGKLTVAQALAALTGAPLSDNHLSIDLARSVFAFGAPGFWDLVIEARLATYRIAARNGLPMLITTNAYDHPTDLPLLEAYEQTVAAEGGTLLPVYLSCAEEIMMARVTEASRVTRRKIATQKGLQRYLEENNFAPVPREGCLRLDTGRLSAEASAEAICDHFGLPRQGRA